MCECVLSNFGFLFAYSLELGFFQQTFDFQNMDAIWREFELQVVFHILFFYSSVINYKSFLNVDSIFLEFVLIHGYIWITLICTDDWKCDL